MEKLANLFIEVIFCQYRYTDQRSFFQNNVSKKNKMLLYKSLLKIRILFVHL